MLKLLALVFHWMFEIHLKYVSNLIQSSKNCTVLCLLTLLTENFITKLKYFETSFFKKYAKICRPC